MAVPQNLPPGTVFRAVQPVPTVNLQPQQRSVVGSPSLDPVQAVPAIDNFALVSGAPPGLEAGSAQVPTLPATPGRNGSGAIAYYASVTPSGARPGRTEVVANGSDRIPSQDANVRFGRGQCGSPVLVPATVPAMAVTSSTPVLRSRSSFGAAAVPVLAMASSQQLHSGGLGTPMRAAQSPQAPRSPRSSRKVSSVADGVSSGVSRTSLLAGSSLGALIGKVNASLQDREEEIRKHQAEQRETEELLARSQEELRQLVSVVSQLNDLQQSATEVLPDVLQLGPERPRLQPKPPFFWQPSQEYAEEFEVSGECGEVVTKRGDFEDQGWVIPVGGAWRLMRGGVYRWTILIEQKCPSRPQLQLGIHGMNHSQPWRLVTTSRCSWSRDDEPWQDRPGGDRLIDEGNFVHVEVDMRGLNAKHGTFSLAINDEPFQLFFEDIPLSAPYPLIPVVSMGGDQSRVRLCPNY